MGDHQLHQKWSGSCKQLLRRVFTVTRVLIRLSRLLLMDSNLYKVKNLRSLTCIKAYINKHYLSCKIRRVELKNLRRTTTPCPPHRSFCVPYSQGQIKRKTCTHASSLEPGQKLTTYVNILKPKQLEQYYSGFACDDLCVYPNKYKLANNAVTT